jgi:hypothetical protein
VIWADLVIKEVAPGVRGRVGTEGLEVAEGNHSKRVSLKAERRSCAGRRGGRRRRRGVVAVVIKGQNCICG